jgi:hypothetical protein
MEQESFRYLNGLPCVLGYGAWVRIILLGVPRKIGHRMASLRSLALGGLAPRRRFASGRFSTRSIPPILTWSIYKVPKTSSPWAIPSLSM